jgi:hypothetical protein
MNLAVQSTKSAVCPECDEVFRFLEASACLSHACPHCRRRIVIEEAANEEEQEPA